MAVVRFLALGDSYTVGEGVEPAARWPVQLAGRLRERGIEVGEPEIIAVTGWTTDELAAGIDRAQPAGPFDLVSLLIGVNNQYRGRTAGEYRQQFRELLTRAIAFAGGEPGRVVVVSIPDWGVTPFAAGRDSGRIRDEIDAFNRANREEADAVGAHYVDITPLTRRWPQEVTGDGLHPSGGQYRRWAESMLPVVMGALTLT